jgi:hypothetical protein
MANVQAAFGFRQISYLSGGSPDYQMQTRLVQATNTTKIFRGDPVVKSGQYIAQASSTTVVLEGIFDGCMYTPVGGGTPQWSPFWPGSAAVDATAYIINAPNAMFLAAALNTAITTTNIGNGIAFAVGTGNTFGGGFSGFTVDSTTLTNATTAPFQVVGLFQGVGNGSDPSSPYNWIQVTFNNQRFRSQAGVT